MWEPRCPTVVDVFRNQGEHDAVVSPPVCLAMGAKAPAMTCDLLIVSELHVQKPEGRIGCRVRDDEGGTLAGTPSRLCSCDAVTQAIRAEWFIIQPASRLGVVRRPGDGLHVLVTPCPQDDFAVSKRRLWRDERERLASNVTSSV